MVVNILKTKEVVFRRPNPRLDVCLVALVGVEQVVSAKLLGIVLRQTPRFDIHVNGILKLCSHRIYLLKLLRDKGLPCHLLSTVQLYCRNYGMQFLYTMVFYQRN